MTTTVRRVQTADGTRVEPPLDRNAPRLDQLRWHAAVVNLDHDLHVTVEPSETLLDGKPIPNLFLVCGMCGSCGPLDFDDARTFLSGIAFGERLARLRR